MNDSIRTEWVSVRCPLCDRMIQDVGVHVDNGSSSGLNSDIVCSCGAMVMVYADFDKRYMSITGAMYSQCDEDTEDEMTEG